MTHTPGPWHRGSDFNDNRFVIFPETGRMRLEPGQGTVLYSIAKVFDSFNEDEDDANTRLIAAAPELYDSLKELLEICRVKCSPHDEQILPSKTNHDAMLDACDVLDRIRKI